MSEAEIFEVLRAHIWGAAMMAMPILACTLVVGFTIGYMTRICVDLFNNSVLPLISR